MSFGYLGDTSTKIKQQVKNQGIISISEAYELEKANHLGGSLELIESQTISSDVAQVDFTDIKANIYDVHRLDIVNATSDTDDKDFALRVSVSSSFITASDYHRGLLSLDNAGNAEDNRATAAAQMDISRRSGNATNEKTNARVYIYNAANASLITHITCHVTSQRENGNMQMVYGGGAYDQAAAVDGLRIFMDGSGDIATGVFNLYGIKQ